MMRLRKRLKMNKPSECQEIAIVNIRINGIPRHKQQVYKKGISNQAIKAIKARLTAELHEQWDNIQTNCTAVNSDIPDEFKRYHEAQEDECGYRKYQVEREPKINGSTTLYSVHAMLKAGGYLKCKLDHVKIDEVRKFVELNPVEE